MWDRFLRMTDAQYFFMFLVAVIWLAATLLLVGHVIVERSLAPATVEYQNPATFNEQIYNDP